jgi:hypothetical protein
VRSRRDVARAKALAAAFLHKDGHKLQEIADILKLHDESAAFKCVRRGLADPVLGQLEEIVSRPAPPPDAPMPGAKPAGPDVSHLLAAVLMEENERLHAALAQMQREQPQLSATWPPVLMEEDHRFDELFAKMRDSMPELHIPPPVLHDLTSDSALTPAELQGRVLKDEYRARFPMPPRRRRQR